MKRPKSRDRGKCIFAGAGPAGLLLLVLLALGSACVTVGEKPPPQEPKGEDAARITAFNYKLAEKFWEQGQMDLALRYLEQAIRMNPELMAPRLRILDVYLHNSASIEALNYLDRCPPEMQGHPAFLKRRALACELGGLGKEAGRILDEAAAGGGGDRQRTMARAENRLLEGKPQEAREMLEKAASRFPEDPSLLRALADLTHTLCRYGEEADYRMKLALLDRGDAANLRAAAHALIRSGRLEEGLGWFCRLSRTSLESEREPVRACLGYLYYRTGDYERAQCLLQQAADGPDFTLDRDETLALAEIQMRNGTYGEAALVLEEGLKRNPNHALTRAALVWAYYRAGRSDSLDALLAEACDLQHGESILQFVKERVEREAHAQ